MLMIPGGVNVMKWGSITLIFVFSLIMVFHPFAAKANDHLHKSEEKSEILEESGEFIGWTSALLAGFALSLFPARRSAPYLLKHSVIKQNPQICTSIKGIIKAVGKGHMTAGVLVLLLSICHGYLMLIYEGEIGPREFIGLGGIGFLVFSLFTGRFLSQNRHRKGIRQFHIVSVFLFIVFSMVHIVLD